MANKNETTEKKTRKSESLPENPQDRFKIIANRRGGNVLKIIDGLGVFRSQFGNKPNKYHFTEAQAEQLCQAIRDKADWLEAEMKAALAGDSEEGETKTAIFE